MSEEEWEKTRDDRVNNWRNFSKKKSVIGIFCSLSFIYLLKAFWINLLLNYNNLKERKNQINKLEPLK